MDLALFRLGVLPVKHEHVADRADYLAVGVGGNGLRELTLLIFEVQKSDFDEFVVFQSLVNRGEDVGRETAFADLGERFEMVGESA